MLTNFWRSSHLLLAIFSGGLLLIASLTGMILSTEPVVEHFNSPSDKIAADTISLAQFIPQLKEEFIEVFSVEVDEEKAVKVDVIGFDENKDGAFYIHPSSREKIAEIHPKNEFYTWITTLHRSLFLHSTGRILMGITVFLLLLTSISGIALVIKRTNGFKNIFSHIKKQSSAQYYHTLLGRFAFIPIVIMAFAGTILFIDTQFKPKENTEIQHSPSSTEKIAVSDFSIFQNTTLSDIKTLHFPFSADEEDYFELVLDNRTLKIHQYTGELIAEQNATWFQNLNALSMTLHTGKGQWIWSIVLGLISINLLYFMYSGTKIAWRRMFSKSRNNTSPKNAEFIILIGSENGSTQKFGQLLFNALKEAGKSVFVDGMNHYQEYAKAKHLIILTSTYGEGDAPFNARHFLPKVDKTNQKNRIKTHIIGFGSMMYPKFCQYAIDVHKKLSASNDFIVNSSPTLIDGRSHTSFMLSLEAWKKENALEFEVPQENNRKKVKLSAFQVVEKQIVDDGYTLTFTLELKPQNHQHFQSGDLLAIAPSGDETPRYYSIGKTKEGNILLSIKKHKLGECSSFLYKQEPDDIISAYIKENKPFHLPKKGNVLMIANGTGIAPFLGMTSMYSKQKKTFFLGGRNTLSFKLYHKIIQQNESTDIFNTLHFALSKEEGNQKYVQDLVKEHKKEVARLIKNKGSIMICGSIKMRDGVLEELKTIFQENALPPLEKHIEKGRILMDCY